jgi:hypothetical protein
MTVATTYTITFGMFIPDGSCVSEDEWHLFLTQQVDPLLSSYSFRDELNIWKGEPAPSRVLTYISTEYEDALSIHAIASTYKQQFHQKAVMVNSFASYPEYV